MQNVKAFVKLGYDWDSDKLAILVQYDDSDVPRWRCFDTVRTELHNWPFYTLMMRRQRSAASGVPHICMPRKLT